jgi:hypothetical protein
MPQTNLREAQKRAQKIGVRVEASTRKHKKLDVFKGNKKIASIGDIRYSDYLQHKDEERRKRYKVRHESNRHTPGTPGYYADKILW